ncbi:MAG: RNA polymerase sigma factor [Polyangiaceae bacterium]
MSAKVVELRVPENDAAWSDDAVAFACTSGDAAAVAELFDRFHARISRYLARSIGDCADVDDLLQATFLEVARGRSRFDGRSMVSTWLLGIATNVLRHHLRSLSRRRNLLSAVASARTGEATPSHGDAVAARDALHRVQAVLDELPTEQRMAFVLCEVEGLKAIEAAALLHASETAIWKRVSDARKLVRAALAEDGR